jgi:AcrR family transcriptional regulator
LEAAFLSLIAEQGLARISVADITTRADVNRSTFYEHYSDVHDLAVAACTQTFDELIAATPVIALDRETTGDDIRRGHEALVEVLAHVAARADLYQALLGGEGSARVINHLHQRIVVAIHVDIAGSGADTHADDPSEVPHNPAAALLAGALLGTIMEWLRHGCPGTPEQLALTIRSQLAAAAPQR